MDVGKMTKGLKRVCFGLIAVGLCLALLASACIPQVAKAEPKEKMIKIGLRGLFTGAVASTGVPYCTGTIDYFRYLNDVHGGVNGIPFKILWEDNGSSGVREVSTHKRFKEAGVVAEITYLSLGAEVTTRAQQRDEIPLVSFSYLSDICLTYPIRWVFGGVQTWNSESATAIEWAKGNRTEPRPLRVGIMIYDHPSGWTAIDGIPDYCAKVGVEYIGYEVVPILGCIDATVELLRLAAKKPDWLLFPMCGASFVTVMKDADRLELQEKGIKLCCTVSALDKVYIDIVRKGAENWYVIRHIPAAWETEFPGTKAVREAAKRYRGQQPREIPELYVGGWIGGTIMMEAVRLAIEKVGYENLTGRSVRDGFASIKGFDNGIVLPMFMSDDKPWCIDYVRMYQVQQGWAVPISEWIKKVPPPELGSLVIKK